MEDAAWGRAPVVLCNHLLSTPCMSRLAALEFSQFQVSPDACILYSLSSSACGRFPVNAAGMLRVCSSLATFDEHVARCMKELRIHPAQREATAEVLRSLVTMGFFIEEHDIAIRMASSAAESAP